MMSIDTTLLPILKDNHDPHYRYKMPKLTAKVEGNGNGIKTVLTNISAVAKSLGRPASYPTKYFGCELGAQVKMQDDLYVVNGAHDPDKLLVLLYSFIKRFVLCPKCSNPETDLNVSGGAIRQKCIACGHENLIDRGSHRLTTFIVNHPPPSCANGASGNGGGGSNGEKQNGNGSAALASTNGKSKEKNGKTEKKSSSKKHSKSNGNHQEGKESRKERSKDDQNEANGHSNHNDDDDDADGQFDEEEVSEQAYLDRLHDGLATGMFVNDPKKSADVFYKLVKAKKEAGLLSDVNVQRELFKEASLLGIKDKATLILGEVLFTEAIFDEIATYRQLLLRFCFENRRAQKYLLGAYEKIVGELHREALFQNATKILKQLYDQDIVEEETILEWASKESKKYVSKEMSRKIHERVGPFIKWLKEAEQDDDEEENKTTTATTTTTTATTVTSQKNGKRSPNSGASSPVDDEDDDEEEEDGESPPEEDDGFVAFSHRVSGLKLQTATSENNNIVNGKPLVNGGVQAKDEDDIDIDNI